MNTKKLTLLIIGIAVVVTISFALLSNRNLKSVSTDHATLRPNHPVIYELGSSSCSSCIAMLEVMKKLETNHGEKINIVKVDIFKDEAAQTKFDVRVIPTQVVKNKEGAEVFRNEGFISYDALVAKLDELNLIEDHKAMK